MRLFWVAYLSCLSTSMHCCCVVLLNMYVVCLNQLPYCNHNSSIFSSNFTLLNKVIFILFCSVCLCLARAKARSVRLGQLGLPECLM